MIEPAPINTPMADQNGMLTLPWRKYFMELSTLDGMQMYPAPLATPITTKDGTLTLAWVRYFIDLTTRINAT
jgi:hypothetical protein